MKTIVRILMTAAAVMMFANFANAQQHRCLGGADQEYQAGITAGSTVGWVLTQPVGATATLSIVDPITCSIDWSNAGSIAGTYTLTLTETHASGLCTETEVLSIIVHTPPQATFASATSTACNGLAGEVIANITSDSDWTLSYTIDGVPGSVSRGVADITYDFAPAAVSAVMTFVLTDISNEGCTTGTINAPDTHVVTPVTLAPTITPL